MYAQKTLKNYLDALAAKQPIPGGGSASALVAALAVALDSMVANFTVGNKRYRRIRPQIRNLLKKNERIRKKLLGLVDKDTVAYLKLNAAFKLPKDDKKRSNLLAHCLKQAALVPFEICLLSAEGMPVCAKIAQDGNPNLITDAGGAAYLLESAFFAAELNVRINLKFIKDKKFNRQKDKTLRKLAKRIHNLKTGIIKRVEGSL